MFDSPAPASGYATTVTLVTGLAWPIVTGVVVVVFRSQIAELLRVLTERLLSAQSFKLGPVEVGGIFQAAEERTRAHLSKEPMPKDIPAEQVKSSEKLEEQLDASAVPLSDRLAVVKLRLTKLANEYDRLRSEASPGDYRTRRMDEIVSLMRTFALPSIPLLPLLTVSTSPGERLAALAILQVRSTAGYIPWLRSRFAAESQAFMLYNAALVLRRMSRLPEYERGDALQEAIAFALGKVRSFQGGPPDEGTISVLEDAEAFNS